MEFGQLMTDILVNVSCKFEIYLFTIAQVIYENVRIAFFYVLSILTTKETRHFLFVSNSKVPIPELKAVVYCKAKTFQ